MITLGMIGGLIGLVMLIAMRGGRNPKPHRWLTFFMIALPLLPLFAISFGWIFTEMGRQPWIVAGVLPTTAAVSPNVSAGSVLFSTIAYTVVYGILAVVEVGLFWKALKEGCLSSPPVINLLPRARTLRCPSHTEEVTTCFPFLKLLPTRP